MHLLLSDPGADADITHPAKQVDFFLTSTPSTLFVRILIVYIYFLIQSTLPVLPVVSACSLPTQLTVPVHCSRNCVVTPTWLYQLCNVLKQLYANTSNTFMSERFGALCPTQEWLISVSIPPTGADTLLASSCVRSFSPSYSHF